MRGNFFSHYLTQASYAAQDRLELLNNLPVGTKLNIAVLFPKEFQLSNFEVSAEIIWKEIHWKEDWEGYQYGLKFIRILNVDQWKLKGLLIEPPEI